MSFCFCKLDPQSGCISYKKVSLIRSKVVTLSEEESEDERSHAGGLDPNSDEEGCCADKLDDAACRLTLRTAGLAVLEDSLGMEEVTPKLSGIEQAFGATLDPS